MSRLGLSSPIFVLFEASYLSNLKSSLRLQSILGQKRLYTRRPFLNQFYQLINRVSRQLSDIYLRLCLPRTM